MSSTRLLKKCHFDERSEEKSLIQFKKRFLTSFEMTIRYFLLYPPKGLSLIIVEESILHFFFFFTTIFFGAVFFTIFFGAAFFFTVFFTWRT